MKTFSATTIINAKPEALWKILTDAPRYTEWDPTMERIEGSIEPGSKIKVFSKLSPGRAFALKVASFDPPREMTWRGGMPLGFLFKGVRTFTLTPQGDGKTEFRVQEVFSGLMLPMIAPSLPDFTEPFQQLAAGLKKRAESGGG